MSNEDKTTDPLKQLLVEVREIKTRLTSLEAKVDDRLRETRPIWENALKEIADTREEMRQGFERIEKEQKRQSRKLDLLHDDMLNLRTDDKELDERITVLEHNSPTERIP